MSQACGPKIHNQPMRNVWPIGTAQPAARKPAVGEGRRILLADDDNALRKLMSQILSQQGYVVREVADGQQAVDQIAEFRPDLVILDVRMPILSGIEACRKMKEDPATRDIPVVIVTSLDPEEGARDAYQAGADDYLVKPVEYPELQIRIATILRIRSLRSEQARNPGGGKSAMEPLDPLHSWFQWHALATRSHEIRLLRARVAAVTSEFLNGLPPQAIQSQSDSHPKAHREIQDLLSARIEKFFREEPKYENAPLTSENRQMLLRELLYDRFAFGPIQPLLDDDRITDILVNRFNEIHIELGGRLVRTPVRFNDEAHLRQIMTVVLRFSGKDINESRPYVETRLRDGSRISATVPPLSIDGATLTIRKFVAKRMALTDLLRMGTLSPEMAVVLDLFVRAGLNIIVSGATGAGKTTLLNLLGSSIPHDERIITVEDTAELQIRQRDLDPEMMGRANHKDVPAQNMERFEARSSPMENLEISIRDIIRLALRKRPDRIIVGEVRGGEALDMLNAMNTGHRGCLSTIHANNTTDMMVRLENMVLEANPALPISAAQRMIVAALSLAIQVVKFANNSRRITEVTEIAGYDPAEGRIVLRPVFAFRPDSVNPFVVADAPSAKIRGLVEEYLIRTGGYRADWDAPGTDEEALNAARRLFERHAEVHFLPWMMRGASQNEKKIAARKICRSIADEIWSGKPEEGFADEEEHDFLLHLSRESRLRTARRLGLPNECLDLLTRPDPPDREVWERFFPEDAKSVGRSETAPVVSGEGLAPDDVSMALYSITSGKKPARSSDSLSARSERVQMLKILMPYLRLDLESRVDR